MRWQHCDDDGDFVKRQYYTASKVELATAEADKAIKLFDYSANTQRK